MISPPLFGFKLVLNSDIETIWSIFLQPFRCSLPSPYEDLSNYVNLSELNVTSGPATPRERESVKRDLFIRKCILRRTSTTWTPLSGLYTVEIRVQFRFEATSEVLVRGFRQQNKNVGAVGSKWHHRYQSEDVTSVQGPNLLFNLSPTWYQSY